MFDISADDDAFLVPLSAEDSDDDAGSVHSQVGCSGSDEDARDNTDGHEDEESDDEQATEEAVDYGYVDDSGSSDDDSEADDPAIRSDEDNSELESDDDM